jgi:hypothetical protein
MHCRASASILDKTELLALIEYWFGQSRSQDYRRRPPPAIPPVFGINVDPLGDVLMKALPEGFAALSAAAATLPAPLLMAPVPTPVVMPAVAPGIEDASGPNTAAFDAGSMVARINPATVAVIKAFGICDLRSTAIR